MLTSRHLRRSLLAGSAMLSLSAAVASVPAHAVVPNEDKTPAEIVDNADRFRGVGVVVTNVVGQGGIGICTGTLINPRTVLFAAHCVNSRPENAYDGTTVRAAVSFNVNALPGVQSWFANSRTNTALSVFNVNRILWDARSVQNPQAAGFIEADIALASLDTPAVGIPTWALLFSTLPAPATSDPVLGTGYHVDLVGYGRSGNAIQGAVLGVDWRRRAAENMLGGFMSLDDRNAFLFGPAAPNLPQNLYHVDFDSQRRQSFFDFNVHRDNARPNEGITAPGDSGGPLILNAARNAINDEDLVIGVLSGGSRFFGGQAFSSLGTASFYQPLSLYWQYIAANNPYRYVGTRAGNGNWEDANHWVTLLDPAYRVINASGQIVNGIPTTPEQGLGARGGDFGAVCAEFEDPDDVCINVGTGQVFGTAPTGGPEMVDFTGSGNAVGEAGETIAVVGEAGRAAGGMIAENAASPAVVELGNAATSAAAGMLGAAEDVAINGEVAMLPVAEDVAINDTVETAEDTPQNTVPALPAPTIANGLPGASGFIANNVNAVNNANPALVVNPRYFDVTLSQTGTTTLNSTVTIDRLTVRGNAGLAVAATGNLTSLIDINQFGGRVNVNGAVRSIGDYTLFGGMLEGTGTITAPFLTSITGVFSPATMGTTGTLTINGNLVMSSGTTYLTDFTGAGASDRIAVNGVASVGGVVGLGAGLTQQVNGQGRRYTILTATGGVSGTFANSTISPILSQAFIYQQNAVLMEIRAASYNTVIDRTNTTQTAYAQLFDQNRPNAALSGLYGLDFATADAIRTTFTNLAPVNEQAVRSLSGQTVNLLQNFNDARMREADRSKAGGKIAMIGTPLDVLQAGLSPMGQPLGAGVMALQDGAENTQMTEANLPEDVAIFLAGGLISGDVDSLPGFRPETGISGFYVAGGLEFYPSESTMLGLSGYFNSLEADTPLGQSVNSDTYAASLYMRHKFGSGAVVDGQFSMGSMGFDTQRRVQFLGGIQQLASSTDDLLVSGALGVSYDLDTSFGTISPGIEGRYASVDLSTVRETGGILGLTIAREKFTSTQARAGFDYEKQAKMIQINANAQMVWEFEDGPQLLGANFAQGVGPNANFVLDSADSNWVELGVSATIGDGPFQFGVGFDTTIGRDSANAKVWRTSATYRF